jgi:uncharacterized protein
MRIPSFIKNIFFAVAMSALMLATPALADDSDSNQQDISKLAELAEQGDAAAQNALGNKYLLGHGVAKDDSEAAKWYRKAAEQGNVIAQKTLGGMYLLGRGVAKDDSEAAKWFRKAAKQGDPATQFNLGMMYASGQGVPQDNSEAVEWFRKAAEQGNADAQNALGNYVGRSKDYVQAYMWLSLAAAQDNAYVKSFDAVKTYMTSEQIAEGQRRAQEWTQQHSKQ